LILADKPTIALSRSSMGSKFGAVWITGFMARPCDDRVLLLYTVYSSFSIYNQ
jgi:hypothetical protein